jgi:hypothetical protein
MLSDTIFLSYSQDLGALSFTDHLALVSWQTNISPPKLKALIWHHFYNLWAFLPQPKFQYPLLSSRQASQRVFLGTLSARPGILFWVMPSTNILFLWACVKSYTHGQLGTFILVGLGIKLSASCLQSRHCTAWATPPVHFALVILEMRPFKIFAQANLKP